MSRLDPKFGAAVKFARLFLREAEVAYQTRPRPLSGRLRSAVEVVQFVERQFPGIRTEEQEVFVALSMSAKHMVKNAFEIARGTLASVDVHPREAFRRLIMDAAAHCLFVHNHPSGDPEPSCDDLALTTRLRDVGRLVGISVLDHVIIGEGDSFVSLAERGLL
jgi:DNA repair protein RadC